MSVSVSADSARLRGWAHALLMRMSSFPSVILATSSLQAAMLALSVTSSWTAVMPMSAMDLRTLTLRAVAMTWQPGSVSW